MLYYTIVLDPESDTAGYTAWAPALPDCRARGDTVNEALAAVRELIEARLERLAAHGLPPPADVAPAVISVEVVAPTGRPPGREPA